MTWITQGLEFCSVGLLRKSCPVEFREELCMFEELWLFEDGEGSFVMKERAAQMRR
jgi:hypothetical protein